MIGLQIPKRHGESIRQLLKKDFEIIKELASKLSEIEGRLTSDVIKAKIESVNELTDLNADTLAKVIIGIFTTKGGISLSDSEYADSIIESICADDDIPDLAKEKLLSILSISGDFKFASKAIDLNISRDNILISSRVLTDIRPVFTDPPECESSRSIIIHTLRLEYKKENGETGVFTAGIDSDDLERLRDCIERSQKKEEIIKDKLSNGPFKVLEI